MPRGPAVAVRLRRILRYTPVARYAEAIKQTPNEVLYSPSLLFSCMFYATAAIPHTWDQGSYALIQNLPGFQQHFGVGDGQNAAAIRNLVSFVYIGCIPGALFCFFVNDRLGRLWALRLWMCIWMLGQLIGVSADNLGTLWASRIISGIGLGASSVSGTLAIVEIAPAEIRGLLASWYSIAMSVALSCSQLCVYGIFLHMAPSRLQYQIVMFAPCIYLSLCIIASFSLCDSPRWLSLVDRHEDAVKTLVRLRRLPADHPRILMEMADITESVRSATQLCGPNSGFQGLFATVQETFTVRANLRRLQQAVIMYALPLLSGANSITAYLVPILQILGHDGGTSNHIFLSSMYSTAKIGYCIIASFLLVDALGRRKSIFIGATIQAITDIYLGGFIKVKETGPVDSGSSQAALAAIFIHGFGYSIGLLVLPYILGSEIWPTRIRAFGSSVSAAIHWALHCAMTYGVPSLLAQTNTWGAFIFFAAWCVIAIVYVYLFVPEISGLGVEEIDEVFQGPWVVAGKGSRRVEALPAKVVDAEGIVDDGGQHKWKSSSELRENI